MIIDPSTRPHQRLKMDAVRAIMNEHAKEHPPTGELITSPWDLYSVEYLRDAHGLRTGQSIPCDIFVFGKGEPDDPSATKVGGKVALPRGMKWPVGSGGQPLKFLAQFNFAESRALFPRELPGSLLIVAAEDDEDWVWEDEGLHFFWVDTYDGVIPREVPVVSLVGGPFYGVRHRSCDYPDACEKTDELKLSQAYNLPILNGTKIGGLPAHIQDDNADGTALFLGQLGSIQAAPFAPYPWTNFKEPLGLNSYNSSNNIAMFGDMGSIFLYLKKDGTVSRNFESH